MTSGNENDRARAAIEFAAELRHLLRQIHGSAPSTDQLVAGVDAVRALRAELDAPEVAPWYRYEDDSEGSADPEVVAALRRQRFREKSLFRGTTQPLAVPMVADVEVVDGERRIVGRVNVDPMYEGPPGAVHGGYVAGLFDDMLGAAQRLSEGMSGVTGKLTVRYRRPTPLGVDLRFEAWLQDERDRSMTARARCVADGEVTAEAEALFIRVDLAKMAQGERSDD